MIDYLPTTSTYLQRLEQSNPGYEAVDTGKEIVLFPVDRVGEKARQVHKDRMAAFATNKIVTVG